MLYVGFFDIGDVFLNVCGIMFGYIVICFLFLRKYKEFKVKLIS